MSYGVPEDLIEVLLILLCQQLENLIKNIS